MGVRHYVSCLAAFLVSAQLVSTSESSKLLGANNPSCSVPPFQCHVRRLSTRQDGASCNTPYEVHLEPSTLRAPPRCFSVSSTAQSQSFLGISRNLHHRRSGKFARFTSQWAPLQWQESFEWCKESMDLELPGRLLWIPDCGVMLTDIEIQFTVVEEDGHTCTFSKSIAEATTLDLHTDLRPPQRVVRALGECTYDAHDLRSELATCASAGIFQCCPGTDSTCSSETTPSCHCDEACFRVGDCCHDLTCQCDITPASAIISSPSAQSMTINVGQSLEMSCRGAGVPLPRMDWFKDGRILSADNASVTFQDTSLGSQTFGTSTDTQIAIVYFDPKSTGVRTNLNIETAFLSHAGVYTCAAQNNGGVSTVARTVFVRGATLTAQRTVYEMGSDAEYTCSLLLPDSEIEYRFKWIHTNSPTSDAIDVTQSLKYSVAGDRDTESVNETLTIKQVGYTDRGMYTCVVMETVGGTGLEYETEPAELEVKGPLIVRLTGSSSVNETETIQFHCSAFGFPEPGSVLWFKDQDCISNRGGVNIDTVGPLDGDLGLPTIESTLTISNATVEDSGVFECEARRSVQDTVTGPSIAMEVIADDDCAVTNGGSPCQNEGVCLDGFRSFYCLCPLRYSGDVCSEPGGTEPEVPRITGPPQASVELTAVAQSVTLSCVATGSPTPNYQWFRDGQQVPSTELPSLHIPEVFPSHRGAYTCQAVNSAGFSSQSEAALLTISGVFQYRVKLVFDEPQTASDITHLTTQLKKLAAAERCGYFAVNASADPVTPVRNHADINIIVTTVVASGANQPPEVIQIQQELEAFQNNTIIPFQVASIHRHDGCSALNESLSTSTILLQWPESELGSDPIILQCPCQELLGATSVIKRQCVGNFTDGADWDETEFLGEQDCGLSGTALELCEAFLRYSTDPQVLAGIVAALTARADLTASDITLAVGIIEGLTDAAIRYPEVRDKHLQAIDNLAGADADVLYQSHVKSNSSTRLLGGLQVLANFVSVSNSNSTDDQRSRAIIGQRNFALLVQDVSRQLFPGEAFSINLNSVEKAMNNTERLGSENLVTMIKSLEDATASLRVPPLSGRTNIARRAAEEDTVRLTYSVFTTGSLFQTEDNIANNRSLGSIILAVSLHGGNRSANLSEPVELEFLKSESARNTSKLTASVACAQYDTGDGGFGSWSVDSCRVIEESEDRIRCECAQPSHFGLLFDLSPGEPFAAIALEVITYIGLAVSITCLLLLLITYAASKKLRSSTHGQMLMHLSGALLGLYVTFLIAGHVTTVPALCSVVSALLQFFLLVYSMWTAAEAIFLYTKLVIVLGRDIPHYVLKAGIIAWFVPAVIVIVSVAAAHSYYANPFFCRATQYPFWFAMILPFIVIYVFDWVVFAVIMCSLVVKPNRSLAPAKVEGSSGLRQKLTILKKDLLIAVGLASVFGLSWGFGLATTTSSKKEVTFAFQLLFSIFVGFQGALLFFFHAVRSRDAQRLWMSLLYTAVGKRDQFNSSRFASSSGIYRNNRRGSSTHITSSGGTLRKDRPPSPVLTATNDFSTYETKDAVPANGTATEYNTEKNSLSNSTPTVTMFEKTPAPGKGTEEGSPSPPAGPAPTGNTPASEEKHMAPGPEKGTGEDSAPPSEPTNDSPMEEKPAPPVAPSPEKGTGEASAPPSEPTNDSPMEEKSAPPVAPSPEKDTGEDSAPPPAGSVPVATAEDKMEGESTDSTDVVPPTPTALSPEQESNTEEL